MSHELHAVLQQLFLQKSPEALEACLSHPTFKSFIEHFELNLPTKEFSQAFVHTSFSHEFGVPHQEQLEFLGDSVLQLIITEKICSLYPLESEGKLSKLRSSIVNEKVLADLGRALGLSELILVGKGEFKKQLFEQDTVLADTVEAMLGVVYRERGFAFVATLVRDWIDDFLPQVYELSGLDGFDAKSKLQERTLAKFKQLPRYVSTQLREGEFLVELWIQEELVEKGTFPSKKLGEKTLAENVLNKNLI